MSNRDRDRRAGARCKKLRPKLKATGQRIHHLSTIAPGPARQRVRLDIAADLSLIGSQIYETAAEIL